MEVLIRKDTFNILKYGGKADGITLNTKAIADAITAATNSGGGTVLVPKGFWAYRTDRVEEQHQPARGERCCVAVYHIIPMSTPW